MHNPIVTVSERPNHVRIEISLPDGESFLIEATNRGMVITGCLDTGDMIVKPKTANQVLIAKVKSVTL